MNLKNLFKPQLLEARVKSSNSEEGLMYAVSHHKGSSIFLYIDGQNDVLLGDRWHTVTSLCVHNNWLYDGGYKSAKFPFFHELNETLGFVIDTITGKDVMERKNNPVSALCSHNGKLCRGDDRGGIYEVSPVKLVAVRFGKVTTLCSHEGVLYDGGYYKGMYNTLKNEVKHKKKYVPYLCSNQKELFGVNYKHNDNFYFKGEIFDVLKNKKIKDIQETLTSMCSYKDALYYSYSDVIIGLNTEWLKHDKKGIHITTICSIPKELKEQIIHTKNYGFNLNDVQRINPKGFIGYLTDVIPDEEKQKMISQIFSYDQVHEEVVNWLNKNEKDIMRKAAFY